MSRPRALVSEDDPAIREVAAMLLTSAGYDVVAVISAQHALAAAAQSSFDLIVLDVDGTGRGLEALPALKRRADGVLARVVVMSSNDDLRAVAAARGADAFAPKPFALKDILG